MKTFFKILNAKLIKFNKWEEIESFINEHLQASPGEAKALDSAVAGGQCFEIGGASPRTREGRFGTKLADCAQRSIDQSSGPLGQASYLNNKHSDKGITTTKAKEAQKNTASPALRLLQKHNTSNAPRIKLPKQKTKPEPDVKFGDIMLPTFSEDGSLLGFQVRADLAIMLFI